MIEAGQRADKLAAASPDFASYEEALEYFLRATNVIDAWTHFTSVSQRQLAFDDLTDDRN
jgi:hypothetical protein